MKKLNIKSLPAVVIGGIIVLGLGFTTLKAVVNSQHIGQVGVWTSVTNKFVKTTEDAGINNWNPFNRVSFYDVKNNTVKFSAIDKSKEDESSGYSPSITIQNKEGVSGEIELSVIYSIKPDRVKEIWEKYGSQQAFNSNFILQIIRSNVRDVFTEYTSLQTYNDRGAIEKAINDNLVKEFEDKGVLIDNVSLQNINYSQDIVDSFNTYQKKAVEIENARAEKEKALIEADKKVEVAKKEAEANKIQSESLTDRILADKYIDAIRDTQNRVIITDGKSTPFINIGGEESK